MIEYIYTPIAFILGLLIFTPKGDKLVKLTLSKEELEKYDIQRLRWIYGLFLLLLIPAIFLLRVGENKYTGLLLLCGALILLVTVAIILVKTWAKRKL